MDPTARLVTPATRRTIVATGAKLAYAAPLVAASLKVSAVAVSAANLISPGPPPPPDRSLCGCYPAEHRYRVIRPHDVVTPLLRHVRPRRRVGLPRDRPALPIPRGGGLLRPGLRTALQPREAARLLASTLAPRVHAPRGLRAPLLLLRL